MPGDDAGGTNTLHAIVMAALVVAAALILGYVAFDLQVTVIPDETQPEASFAFSHEPATDRLVVTHRGGDTLDPDRVVLLNQGLERLASWPGDDPITAGDSTVATPVDASDTVYVMWVTDDGEYVTLTTWQRGADAATTASTTNETAPHADGLDV